MLSHGPSRRLLARMRRLRAVRLLPPVLLTFLVLV